MTRLLIVDDHEPALCTLQAALEVNGYEVITATNGSEALEVARDGPPDIIVSEVLMPVMDGFALCREWKLDQQLKEIPFLFLTASYASPEDKAFGRSLGVERFLVKPIEPELLARILQEVVEAHQAYQLVASREPSLDDTNYLKEYSKALIRKLETQKLQSGEANQALERDIAGRKEAEAALARYDRRLPVPNWAIRELTASLDLQQVLEQLLREATDIVGAEGASVWLWDEEREGWLACRAASHPDLSRSLLNIRLCPGQGLAGWVAQSGESAIAVGTPEDSRFFSGIDEQTGLRTTSLLAVPLRAREAMIGVLELMNKPIGGFDTDDLALVETMAASAAIAIENASLHRQVLDHAERLEQRVHERTVELQTQYARLDAIQRSTTDGIVVADRDRNVIQANPVARAWLTQLLSREDAERLWETIQTAAQQAEERSKTVLELTGLDLELSAAPVVEQGKEDSSTAVVIAIHDVSHLKALDRMKSRFMTNISHELRTPIATIQSYAYLMRRTPPGDEKWRRYLDALVTETERQARLADDLLQVSRIHAGRLELKPRPTPLNELTSAAVAHHKTLAQERGLTLQQNLMDAPGAGPGPIALVDPKQIMQVLSNLVENAIDYTPPGGQVTVVTAQKEVEGRVWAMAAVSDTGEMILREDLSHAFERLFREGEPQTDRISESGLMLMIVKGIVELHGGRVTVESPSTAQDSSALETGEGSIGSTFTVWLPVVGHRRGGGRRDKSLDSQFSIAAFDSGTGDRQSQTGAEGEVHYS